MTQQGGDGFHRIGGELISETERRDWQNVPETARRVALALGPNPWEDARHLLPPIPLLPPSAPLPPGPHPGVEFVVDLLGTYPQTTVAVRSAFAPEKLAGLGFAQLWARTTSRPDHWIPLYDAPEEGKLGALALAWELGGLLSVGTDTIQELAGYVLRANEKASVLGLRAEPRETPETAARRASRLIALKARFARSIEMRLAPQGRSFPARAVWRAAYGLGLVWGDMDLFHWREPNSGRPLFSMSALGATGYFLPERAAEGEGTPGLALSFELPLAPAPLETYDRMSVALAYLRQKLGGRPTTPDGQELDGDRLYDDRDALEEAVQEMSRAGIPPGSPETGRLF